jgi:hypothetical protein
VPADRGYDHDKYRRWVVERTLAWLHNYSDYSSATTAATTSTEPASRSPAASSASGGCNRHSETTSNPKGAGSIPGRPNEEKTC